MDATYLLPLRRRRVESDPEWVGYLDAMSRHIQVIVVDGSPAEVFAGHRALLPGTVMHVPVDPARETPNGKVGGVLTGLAYAAHDRVIIADDDVRYDLRTLERTVDLLERYAVVRPQNYFDPLPWHARLDTARTLLNRLTGGDWPGTLGVRRSVLQRSGGYDGTVLFENLELVRTIRAVGGSEVVPLDLYVRRLPGGAGHFLSQRIRQAYDEWARPPRFVCSLTLLPLLSEAVFRARWTWLAIVGGVAIGVAEGGRRRAGGRAVFPFHCSLLAPAWLLERAACSWIALGLRLTRGGVPYRGTILARAANSERELRRRFASYRSEPEGMPV